MYSGTWLLNFLKKSSLPLGVVRLIRGEPGVMVAILPSVYSDITIEIKKGKNLNGIIDVLGIAVPEVHIPILEQCSPISQCISFYSVSYFWCVCAYIRMCPA